MFLGCLSVCMSVCASVSASFCPKPCEHNFWQMTDQNFTIFLWFVYLIPKKNWLDFGFYRSKFKVMTGPYMVRKTLLSVEAYSQRFPVEFYLVGFSLRKVDYFNFDISECLWQVINTGNEVKQMNVCIYKMGSSRFTLWVIKYESCSFLWRPPTDHWG